MDTGNLQPYQSCGDGTAVSAAGYAVFARLGYELARTGGLRLQPPARGSRRAWRRRLQHVAWRAGVRGDSSAHLAGALTTIAMHAGERHSLRSDCVAWQLHLRGSQGRALPLRTIISFFPLERRERRSERQLCWCLRRQPQPPATGTLAPRQSWRLLATRCLDGYQAYVLEPFGCTQLHVVQTDRQHDVAIVEGVSLGDGPHFAWIRLPTLHVLFACARLMCNTTQVSAHASACMGLPDVQIRT